MEKYQSAISHNALGDAPVEVATYTWAGTTTEYDNAHDVQAADDDFMPSR